MKGLGCDEGVGLLTSPKSSPQRKTEDEDDLQKTKTEQDDFQNKTSDHDDASEHVETLHEHVETLHLADVVTPPRRTSKQEVLEGEDGADSFREAELRFVNDNSKELSLRIIYKLTNQKTSLL